MRSSLGTRYATPTSPTAAFTESPRHRRGLSPTQLGLMSSPQKLRWFPLAGCVHPEPVSTRSVATEQVVATAKPVTDVPVKFSMVMKVGFGDSVRIIGAHPLMGEWDVNYGLTMEWGEGDCWSCEAMLPEGTYDFKCAVLRKNASVDWEAGDNRSLEISEDIQSVDIVCSWAHTAATAVSMSYAKPTAADKKDSKKEAAASKEDAVKLSSGRRTDSIAASQGTALEATSSTSASSIAAPSISLAEAIAKAAAEAEARKPSAPSDKQDEQQQRDQQPQPAAASKRPPAPTATTEPPKPNPFAAGTMQELIASAFDDTQRQLIVEQRAQERQQRRKEMDETERTHRETMQSAQEALKQAQEALLQARGLEPQETIPLNPQQLGQLQAAVDAADAAAKPAGSSATNAPPKQLTTATTATSSSPKPPAEPQGPRQLSTAQATAAPTAPSTVDSPPVTPVAQPQPSIAPANSTSSDMAIVIDPVTPDSNGKRSGSKAAVLSAQDSEELIVLDTQESIKNVAAPLASSSPAAAAAAAQAADKPWSTQSAPAVMLSVEAAEESSTELLVPPPSVASDLQAAEEVEEEERAKVPRTGPWLQAAAAVIPHPQKAATGGEDAHFIWSGHPGAMGVADGVSAWAEDGIDAGEYSRVLMQYASDAVQDSHGVVDARQVIKYAQLCTYKPGSSTMCVAVMRPSGKLQIANVGDCGVRIVRSGSIVFETAPQQHDFNLPYQLSHPRMFPQTDTADNADVYEPDVQKGDVIVMASDGLLDNIWEAELCRIIGSFQDQLPGGEFGVEQLKGLADTLAAVGHEHAGDSSFRSPWSVAAGKQGGLLGRLFASKGGKMDDITVLVASVQ